LLLFAQEIEKARTVKVKYNPLEFYPSVSIPYDSDLGPPLASLTRAVSPKADPRTKFNKVFLEPQPCLAWNTLIFLQDMLSLRTLSILAILAAFSASCFGQAGKAELFGTVLDPQSLPVTKAKVTSEALATGARFDVITDDRGEYHLLGLASGQYVLTIEKSGFRPYRQEGITLRIGDQIRLDVKLELGQATQSVNVNAQASLLETASGSVSYHVGQPQLETLPLDGRNFIPLVALSPGVALPGAGSLLPRINGSRPRTNEYLYDGISVLQPEPGQVAFYPIVDAMEEFRLNINSYSPEYGRSNGGTVMVIGKSGSNQLHATLF
jgi:Carboxypeptidase regulatory-like domain